MAIILKSTNYGESSLILQLLTKEYGLIGVMAKGVKSLKSRLRPLTMNFTYGFFYIYYKKDKLSILKDVDIINPYKAIHSDITKIAYLNYLCDLTYQVYKESENKDLFYLLISTLEKMESGLEPAVLAHIIEVKYLSFLGIQLNLDYCVKCGNTKNIVTISIYDGGVICKNCYNKELIVGTKTIKYLRLFQVLDISKIIKIDINTLTINEIDRLLTMYYDKYTGLYLDSKEFMKKMHI